jgi:Ser-Thr-rich glycosyl-phosphatidyl-inositol-anchored membrane family
MRRLFIITISMIGMAWSSHGQEFTIRKVELTAETVILHYDLVDTAKGHLYTVAVFSSRDQFVSSLQKTKGDVGLEVKPGINKRIVWNSKEELGAQFVGDLELEIRGRIYIPFVRFNNFEDYRVIKRGTVRTITWTGGTRQNILNFNLYREGELVTVIPNIPNSGSYDLTIPTSVKPGKGYYFLVSDNKNKDQTMKTGTFQVKRKIPLLVKVLPIVAIAAAVPTLAGGGGSPATESQSIDPNPGPPSSK